MIDDIVCAAQLCEKKNILFNTHKLWSYWLTFYYLESIHPY